jgi:hypothetical protein
LLQSFVTLISEIIATLEQLRIDIEQLKISN